MGIFDFVKDAGENLLKRVGLGDPDPSDIVAKIHEHGLNVESLSVSVNDDVCTINGVACDQPTKEKAVLVAGNVKGIAQVDDQLELPPKPPEAVFYTVARGDSLSKIAREQYGDAMKYPVIFEANKPMLEHPDKIYPGQVLRIPPLASA